MKKSLLALSLATCLFAGCSTPSTPSALLTPAAITTSVATLARIGMDVYPQATPGVALSRDVICGAAAVTNVNPDAIIIDLANLNITNAETKIIVNGSMFLYQQVYNLIDTNSTAKIQPYLQAVCDGLTQALPVGGGLVNVNAAPRHVLLPPHLK